MSAAEPISLYLQLAEGETPDLEVVARAALAWDSLIKEMAAAVDPFMEVRVEFVSGTEGSLRLNNLIRGIARGDRKALLAVAGAILAFFALGVAEHAKDDFAEWFLEQFGHAHEEGYSEEDKAAIERDIQRLLRENVAAEAKRRLFEELDRDPVITGVGATLRPETPPTRIVPREEFKARAGLDIVIEESSERRTTHKAAYPVVLIRAILRDGHPMWRFQHGELPEFSARIEDEEFMDALRAKRTGLELALGVEMVIDLTIKEEKLGGVWHEKERVVSRVISPHVERRQLGLTFGSQN